MKLKEFKQFINSIDEKYNELEVVYNSDSNYIKAEEAIIGANAICLMPSMKNFTSTSYVNPSYMEFRVNPSYMEFRAIESEE